MDSCPTCFVFQMIMNVILLDSVMTTAPIPLAHTVVVVALGGRLTKTTTIVHVGFVLTCL